MSHRTYIVVWRACNKYTKVEIKKGTKSFHVWQYVLPMKYLITKETKLPAATHTSYLRSWHKNLRDIFFCYKLQGQGVWRKNFGKLAQIEKNT